MKRSDTKLHRLKEVAEVELNTTQDSKVLPVSPSAPSTLTTSRLASFPEAERELVSTALRVCEISVGLSFQPEEERVLLLQAFEICIRNGDETLACALVPGLHCEVPVYLVHRAGEQGLVRVLRTLLDCQVPLKAPRCLVNIPVKMLPAARRKDSSLRLFSNSKRVTSNDLLREVLSSGLALDSTMIVQQLISENFSPLLEQLLLQEKLPMDRLTLLTILASPQPEILQRLSSVTPTQLWSSAFDSGTPTLFNSRKVLWCLVDKVPEPASTLTCLYLLFFVEPHDLDRIAMDRLSEALQILTSAEDLETNPLVNHFNPLLAVVVASDLCDRVSRKGLAYRDLFLRQGQALAELALRIQEQYLDYARLKELYEEVAFGKKCLFDILVRSPEKYRKLLRDDAVVSIAEELWRGSLRPGLGLEVCTISSHILRLMTQPADCWHTHSLFKLRCRTASVFQYRCWRRDGYIRYTVETVCLMSVYIVMIDGLINYLDEVQNDGSSETAGDEDMFILAYAATLVLYHLQQFALACFTGASPSLDIRVALDVCLLTLAFLVQDLQTSGGVVQLSEDSTNYLFELCSGLLYLLTGLRVLIVLLRTRTFGPILRMVYVIWKDIANYLLIYVLTLVSFAMLFASALWRIYEFSSIQLTLRTLFHWGIAGLDANEITSKPWLASILGIIWTIISAVFMLNLLIAVLSSRYEQLAPQAQADYVCIVYQSYHQSRCDSDFGSLTIAPAPFNFLTLPALPLYLLFPTHAPRINRFFALLSYQVLFLVGFCAFTLYTGVVSVWTYLLMPVAMVKKGGWRRSFWVVPWVFAGPVYLLFLYFYSLPSFCRYVYYEEEEESTTELSIYRSMKEHLGRLICSIPPFPLSFELLVTTLRQFPGTPLSLLPDSELSSARSSLQSGSLNSASQSSSFMQSLTLLQWRKMRKLLQPFQSLPDPRKPHQRLIDVPRAYEFFRKFSYKPERLKAANIQYVQIALQRTGEFPKA